MVHKKVLYFKKGEFDYEKPSDSRRWLRRDEDHE